MANPRRVSLVIVALLAPKTRKMQSTHSLLPIDRVTNRAGGGPQLFRAEEFDVESPRISAHDGQAWPPSPGDLSFNDSAQDVYAPGDSGISVLDNRSLRRLPRLSKLLCRDQPILRSTLRQRRLPGHP